MIRFVCSSFVCFELSLKASESLKVLTLPRGKLYLAKIS